LEQFQSAITALKTYAEVSFPNGKKQQVFKFCAHAQSHSPLASVPDLKNRITAVVETITPDMLLRMWQELDYRLDVYCVTKGAHIEHL
jgi:hypothetical protein